MGISPYLKELRRHVGAGLLLVPAVSVLIWDETGRLLLVREAETGLWQTVGGAMEPDEAPEQAAIREALEEAGVNVRLDGLRAVAGGPQFRLRYPNGDLVSYVSIIYDAHIGEGRPRADQDEVSEVAWFGPQELAQATLTPFTVELLADAGVALPPSPATARPTPGGDPDGEQSRAELLARHDILLVRAANPSPLTLSGTNTWVLGRDPAWVVDPGPALEEHLGAIQAAVEDRGGLGGIVLTHGHADHSEAVPALRERFRAPLAAATGGAEIELADGAEVGPFTAIAAPGHAPDHFVLVGGGACFSGDAVLGSGSVFISPHPGALTGYLGALDRLRRRGDFDVICPGHGPPVWEPRAKLDEYIAHRNDRERRLIMSLKAGRRTTDELLDDVWSDVAPGLRPAAAVTLAAHLDKLEEEGKLPAGVERGNFEGIEW